jgi:catechol 2,3-dioxygenase-like lactoylglutathione lyase family enzyme
MKHHVHHINLFASDLDKSLAFYQEFFGGQIILDMEVTAARNIFMKVGSGRFHFYDHPPKISGPGSIHHFAIQTDDVERDYQQMKAKGVEFNKAVIDLGYMKYIMVPAPDNILIELFEVNKALLPDEYQDYFD